MSIKRFFLVIIFSCGIFSCTEHETLSPILDTTNSAEKLDNNQNGITVLTRNLYVGADVDRIIQTENPREIPIVVAEVFQSLLETNFPERAQALANEIYMSQPHLIGLQEVSLIRMQSPGDAVLGGTEPAEDVFMDYLDIFLMTMSYMGLDYEVVAKVENADVEMPMLTKFEEPFDEFDDVRLTDYDVILAKKGIKTSHVEARNFNAKVVLSDIGIEFPRGYVAVTAVVNGNKFRFVNTHLEDADQGGDLLSIQLAQANELLSRLNKVNLPIILVGDFNSAADSEPGYKLFASDRYFDTWLWNSNVSNPNGYTYGHDADLRNENQAFWKRIDHIFFSNGKSYNYTLELDRAEAEVLGDEISDRTQSGLWPSDHGGVVAKLKFNAFKKSEKDRF